ncbi:cation transporter dimerization domain-containing protein [Paenibacillus sp. L3-i20]|uniref:cation transporter dimerization domain-containing protein n=1 Tax=Paenibacillus sp. L3-i20 TaxID=2905833 RepID=UPI001EDF7FC5|nr:cation transporter dimerization domain-containing protein [Paenibacillus sp. L3-i20]GKU75687.1 hypothetical protein L3i20_v200840 [Paenibacillus sp. L3-i20]
MSTRQRDVKKYPASRKRLWENVLDDLLRSVRRRRKETVIEESADELMQVIQRVEGVVTVQSLRAKEHGHYVIAEVVISVNPRISVLEGQEIAKKVKLLLMHRFLHLSDVSIYVEPYDPGYPYKSNHELNQEQMPTLLQ